MDLRRIGLRDTFIFRTRHDFLLFYNNNKISGQPLPTSAFESLPKKRFCWLCADRSFATVTDEVHVLCSESQKDRSEVLTSLTVCIWARFSWYWLKSSHLSEKKMFEEHWPVSDGRNKDQGSGWIIKDESMDPWVQLLDMTSKLNEIFCRNNDDS